MLLTDISVIATAIAIGIIIAAAILLVRRRGSIRSSAMQAIILSIAAYMAIILIVPQVICIGPDESHTAYRAPFGYTDPTGEKHQLGISRSYIYNSTGEDAIVYPVTYGENNPGEFPVLIPAGQLTEVPHAPTKFYTSPDRSIESHSSSKTVWHLDTPQKMFERRGNPLGD